MIENYTDVEQLFNDIANEGQATADSVALNPIGDFEDPNNPKREDWTGLMYLYATQLDTPTRLQVVGLSKSVLDILPLSSEFVQEMPLETEVDFYASWLSRYNKHPDPKVGFQLAALAGVLFHEGYEVRCQEWAIVAKQLGTSLEGLSALTFPLMIFTHPDSDIKFIVNCEPVMLG